MAKKRLPTRNAADKNGLTQTIYEGLRQEITTGQLRPGEELSRRQIAARYGCSYIPVIEAMIRLESAGLVEAKSNQMARVRRISVETIENDYVLREAYETQAIRLATLAATEEDIDELYRLAEAIDGQRTGASASPERFDREGLLQHWQFHKRIAELSRYPVLVRALERMEMLARLQANWYFQPQKPDQPHWHALLVDAIKGRDPDKADAAMRVHVRDGLEKELMRYRRGRPV